MNTLTKLERILDNLDSLADTFLAIDVVNQNQAFALPRLALTVPSETMKQYTEQAKILYNEMLEETSTTD